MPNSELDGNIVSGLELEAALEGQLTPSLIPQLREVLFSSLVTSFGLDAVIFANDEANGHVDTLHNVAESQKDGGQPVFKKKEHQDAYDFRGDYNNGEKYRKDTKYTNTRAQYAALQQDGGLVSGYTNKSINEGKAVDVEHRISAYEIHNDGRSALSKVDPVKLANSDSNLTPLEAHVNRAKGKKSPEDFVNYSKEEVFKKRESAIGKIDKKIADGTASDAEIRAKEIIQDNIEDFRAVDGDAVIAKAKEVRSEISAAHSIYYRSKDFLGTTSLHALASGGRMAAKQALGLVLIELFIAVQEAWPSMLRDWQNAPDWQTKLDPRPLLERVAAVLRAAWERIKGKASHILGEATSGFTAGLLSEIVTTIINIFTGTAKSIMRLLRNFWAGIINSLKILLFNPDNLGAEEKLAAVMRILSVAIGGIIQPIVAEAIDKLMVTYAGFVPGFLREVLSQFVGAALGGVVSVSLVYAIDHSPVVHAITEAARKAGDFTDAVYQQIARLTGLAWETLNAQVGVLDAQMAVAGQLSDFMEQQRANSNRYRGVTIRYQAMAQDLSISEEHLHTTIAASNAAVEVRTTTISVMRKGLESWEQDGSELSRLISDYKLEE